MEIEQTNGVYGGADGFYHVNLVPETFEGNQNTWISGRYIFGVVATEGGDRGQTSCAVLVD